MKRLIIGDIHGCWWEMQELLDKAGLSSGDEIISIGDIVDRGPDSVQVFEFFQDTPNTKVVKGNHEHKHVRIFQGEEKAAVSQQITRRQFGEERYREAIGIMDSFPLYLELPEAILVHGFYEPGKSLKEQRPMVLVGTMTGELYMKSHYEKSWYEMYYGTKPIIAGHHCYTGTGKPLICQDRVFCIDTGCCYGGTLTGIILPDFQIISVKSHKDYWKETKDMYPDITLWSIPDESLSWEDKYRLITAFEAQSSCEPAVVERLERLIADTAEVEERLNQVFDFVQRENGRILKELEDEYEYENLSEKEQGSLYAKRIGNRPMLILLHRARKSELTKDYLRNHFKTLENLEEFARNIDLM